MQRSIPWSLSEKWAELTTKLLMHVHEHRGSCVEQKWMGAKHKYTLTCAAGHTWRALGSRLIHPGTWCKICADKAARKHLSEDDLRSARRLAARKFADKPETKEKAKRRYLQRSRAPGFKEKNKEHKLQRDYGISLNEFREMIAKQGDRCALCQRPFKEIFSKHAGSPVVDHCHTTGKIRGILHRSCNAALGLIGDSLEAAQNLVRYLE